VYASGATTDHGYSNVIADNVIWKSYMQAIYLIYQDYSVVEGNAIYEPDYNDTGTEPAIHLLNCTFISVTGNVVTEGGSTAIYLDTTTYCSVNNNILRNNTGWGINCNAEDYSTFIGNVMNGNTSGDTVNGEGAHSKVAHNIGDATHTV
jgi:parallel beta-helix repeat protein